MRPEICMRGLEELNLYVRSRNKRFDFSALLLWSVLWACGAQAQTPDTGKAHVWDTYVNARFAYSVCYPGDVLLPQGEADNGDGQKFITKDGKAEARVYGSYFASNGEDQSLKKTYLDEIQSVQKNGFTVTYKLLKADQFVLSGSRKGKIFYEKIVLIGGIFKTLRLEYTNDTKADFDTITSTMASCFQTRLLIKQKLHKRTRK